MDKSLRATFIQLQESSCKRIQDGKQHTNTHVHTKHPPRSTSSLVRNVSRLHKGGKRATTTKALSLQMLIFLIPPFVNSQRKATLGATHGYGGYGPYMSQSKQAHILKCSCHCKDTLQKTTTSDTSIPLRAQLMSQEKKNRGVPQLFLVRSWPNT